MKRLWLLALIPLFAACSDTEYKAEPVVGPDDQRGTEVPNYDDNDAIAEQDCFRIALWTDRGFSTDTKNIGIACFVDDNKEGDD